MSSTTAGRLAPLAAAAVAGVLWWVFDPGATLGAVLFGITIGVAFELSRENLDLHLIYHQDSACPKCRFVREARRLRRGR
jgi:hypothetical protein